MAHPLTGKELQPVTGQRLEAAAESSRQPKRKASGDHPDDPRLETGEGAEVVMDADPVPATGTKRRADAEADDSARGDLGSVDANVECKHCGQTYASRNLLFKHLYDRHDADSEGIRAVRPLMAVEAFSASAGCCEARVGMRVTFA